MLSNFLREIALIPSVTAIKNAHNFLPEIRKKLFVQSISSFITQSENGLFQRNSPKWPTQKNLVGKS